MAMTTRMMIYAFSAFTAVIFCRYRAVIARVINISFAMALIIIFEKTGTEPET